MVQSLHEAPTAALTAPHLVSLQSSNLASSAVYT